MHGTIHTAHTTYAAAFRTTTQPNVGSENHIR